MLRSSIWVKQEQIKNLSENRRNLLTQKKVAPNCILCKSSDTFHYCRDDTRMENIRDYYCCKNCLLIFVTPEQRLSRKEELSRYELHENDPSDPRYRKFLSRVFNPMIERVGKTCIGLDFGSGPGPTLSVMFEEQGYKMNIYDSFYQKDPSVFELKYDFITATEVIEHLFDPLFELDRIWSCLKLGGYFGIMTKRLPEKIEFQDWHYKNDDTHIAFYSKKTFSWIGRRWDSPPKFIGKDVTIYQKQIAGN